jgi:uncharacterized protein YdcH (DUF465 family)
MGYVPHDVAAEFPEALDRICELKEKNPYFSWLLETFEEVTTVTRFSESSDLSAEDDDSEIFHDIRIDLRARISRMIAHA